MMSRACNITFQLRGNDVCGSLESVGVNHILRGRIKAIIIGGGGSDVAQDVVSNTSSTLSGLSTTASWIRHARPSWPRMGSFKSGAAVAWARNSTVQPGLGPGRDTDRLACRVQKRCISTTFQPVKSCRCCGMEAVSVTMGSNVLRNIPEDLPSALPHCDATDKVR